MTDYPQYIVAEACRIANEQMANGTANWKPYEHARSATIQAICLALTMTPPEPPKDVLENAVRCALPGSMPDHHALAIAKNLRTELARLGHEVAPIRQPVSEEVIEWEAVSILLQWGRPVATRGLAEAILRRGIELAGGR